MPLLFSIFFTLADSSALHSQQILHFSNVTSLPHCKLKCLADVTSGYLCSYGNIDASYGMSLQWHSVYCTISTTYGAPQATSAFLHVHYHIE